jgi:DNA-directed RNA polymerase specialized sigma subunit
MRTVKATAERGKKDWWVLEAPEAGAVSQCRRLSQADEEIREAIAYQLGIPEDSFDIELDVRLPKAYRDALVEAQHLQDEADHALSAAAAARRRAVHALADANLSVRDIGQVMGISHQRASQLLKVA